MDFKWTLLKTIIYAHLEYFKGKLSDDISDKYADNAVKLWDTLSGIIVAIEDNDTVFSERLENLKVEGITAISKAALLTSVKAAKKAKEEEGNGSGFDAGGFSLDGNDTVN